MAQQRAGQKRKVIEIPRPGEEEEEELANEDLNGTLEDDGESEEDESEVGSREELDEEEDEDVGEEEDEALGSDEIPSSEDEADVRQQIQDLKTSNGWKTPPQQLMGSDTAIDVSTLSPETPVKRLEEDAEDKPSYRVVTDANGNPRYVYGEIDGMRWVRTEETAADHRDRMHPFLMTQVAVRLTAVSLHFLREILQGDPEPDMDEYQCQERKLSVDIRRRLDEALPYFQWQGAINRHARAQYLMALLEEAIRSLAPPIDLFVNALTADSASTQAFQPIMLSIDKIPADDVALTVAESRTKPFTKRHRPHVADPLVLRREFRCPAKRRTENAGW